MRRLLLNVKIFSTKVQNVFTLLLGSIPICLDLSFVSDTFKIFYRDMFLWWIKFIFLTLICFVVWYIAKRFFSARQVVVTTGWILSHIISILLGFLLALTIYSMNYTYNFDDYKNAVFDGKTETVELYYSHFSQEKDFFEKYENFDIISPCVLLWGIECQHKEYKEIFAIACKHKFNVEYKFYFSYYTKFKKQRYHTVAYEKILYAIGEFLGMKYENKFTSSQYIIALSDAEFTPEFLEFLYTNGFNFEEGLQLRKEIHQYIHSSSFYIYNLNRNIQLQKTLANFLSNEEEKTKKIQDFMREKGLINSTDR